MPPSHHRKRLAVESRHHSRPDDSHMFIIKLPPNPVYYTKTNAAHEKNSIEDKNNKKVIITNVVSKIKLAMYATFDIKLQVKRD